MSTQSPPFRTATARQWELAHAQAIVEWLHSSGIAQRMLADVCQAVEATASSLVRGNPAVARAVIEEFPRVLRECDSLDFDTGEQALAYLILHMPTRFLRVFRTLERLLLAGVLPIGKSSNFAAIDIGAGPGPGIIAIRGFYAALAHYASQLDDQAWQVATLSHANVVERSYAMPSVMHYYAEMLVMAEQGRHGPPGTTQSMGPNPCGAELAQSRLAFGARYDDFGSLDIRQSHTEERHRQAFHLYDDPDEGLTLPEAFRIAHEEATDWPSGYPLALMMNFLTTTEAIPAFSDAINKLMQGSLVPGGLILVLGATNEKYEAIYQELDRRARAARLTVIQDFEDSLQTAGTEAELQALSTATRTIWHLLADLAGDVSQTAEELRRMRAADILDERVRFSVPGFRVRAYRRGRLPTVQSSKRSPA